MRNHLLAGAAVLALLPATAMAAAAPTYIGNICGTPAWTHIGAAVTQFTLTKITSQLPSPLTPTTLYFIPEPSDLFPTTGYGNVVAGVDVAVRRALGQPACFDVYSDQYATDDGPSYHARDNEAPHE